MLRKKTIYLNFRRQVPTNIGKMIVWKNVHQNNIYAYFKFEFFYQINSKLMKMKNKYNE